MKPVTFPHWVTRIELVPSIRRPGIEEIYKSIRNELRKYSAGSLIDAALEELRQPFSDPVSKLESRPWHTLLIVKWALQDRMVDLRAGRTLDRATLERLSMRLFDAQGALETRARDASFWILFRKMVGVQIEFQRPIGWGFMRWAALYARLPENSGARQQFRQALGMEPTAYIDLCFALYTLVHDGTYFFERDLARLRPLHNGAIDAILALFAKDIASLRDAMTDGSSSRIRGEPELYEFPYLKRHPIYRDRHGRLAVWHPLVFARGAEETVHLRLAQRFGAEYSRSFSRVFEQYVIELVRDSDLPYMGEDEYKQIAGREGVKAVEAVISSPSCNILVEAKMGLFTDEVMLVDDEDFLRQKTERVRQAIEQGRGVSQALRTVPELAARYERPCDFLMVVTSRDLLIGGGLAWHRLLPEVTRPNVVPQTEATLPLHHIFVLSIEEFERVMGAVRAGDIDLAMFLKESAERNREPATSTMFLSDFLRQKRKAWTKPLLLDRAIAASTERLQAVLPE